MNYVSVVLQTGHYFIEKYLERARQSGHAATANQMRKQGIPLFVAVKILFGRRERFTHLRKEANG